MADRPLTLLNVKNMEVDDTEAVFTDRKIKVSTGLEMRRAIALLVNTALDPAIGINNQLSTALRTVLNNGSFAIWVAGGYFEVIGNILRGDGENFVEVDSVAHLLSEFKPTELSFDPKHADPNATTRLLSLFLTFTCLAKGNAARSQLSAGVQIVENTSIRRRYIAMVAQKNLPGDNIAGTFLQSLPPGCMEACQGALWRNAEVAQSLISWALTSNPTAEADRALVSQLKLLYTGAEMTFTKITDDFLTLCESQLKLMPKVVEEAELFLETKERLKGKHGDHVLHLRLYRHPDADALAPRAYPFLAGAAYYWLNDRNRRAVGAQMAANVVEANTSQGGYSTAEMGLYHGRQIPQDLRTSTLGTALSRRFCLATGLRPGLTSAQVQNVTTPSSTAAMNDLATLLGRLMNQQQQ